MEILEVEASDYARTIGAPLVAFDSVEFNALNAAKADGGVRHLLFASNGKPRLGLIAGICGRELRAPFSAPFAALEPIGQQRLDYYVEAAAALSAWLRERDLAGRIILPPPCYGGEAIARQLPALLTAPGASLAWTDFNYHLDLGTDFRSGLLSKTRSILNAAMRNELMFETGTPLDEAHAVIADNHAAMGYPAPISLNALEATSKIIRIECFGLRHQGELAAAGIMYLTADDVVQDIYWGDRPSFRALHPMNLLAAELFEHYKQRGFRIFDLGPASSHGIPALGLCYFKAGLGALLTPKPTVQLITHK